VLAGLAAVLWPVTALAHDISEQAQQMMLQGNLAEVAWIGADHMLTGWDHLLFLLGVLLFLTNFGQIVRFITAFTLGHTVTLVGSTYLNISADAYSRHRPAAGEPHAKVSPLEVAPQRHIRHRR